MNWSQLNTYLNFYKTEVNESGDNPPIGILICTEKDEIGAEYILEGFENNVFASRFAYVLPDKEDLIRELENALNKECLAIIKRTSFGMECQE